MNNNSKNVYEIACSVMSEDWVKSKSKEYIEFTISNIYEFIRQSNQDGYDDCIYDLGCLGDWLEKTL